MIEKYTEVRKLFEQRLREYAEQHREVVSPAIEAMWKIWLDELEGFLVSRPRDQGFAGNATDPQRFEIVKKHLRGDGIEIGALCSPQRLPESARVRYVDRDPLEMLEYAYYDVNQYSFVDVDVLDDGEVLASFADDSLDFVIASHFLEHCEDPIGAILSHLRVLRPGGKIFYVVPDCRATFDQTRERTTREHVWRDHEEGPHISREAHYVDWTRVAYDREGVEFEAWWRASDALNMSIHFHVWAPADVEALLLDVRDRLDLRFEIHDFTQLPGECAFVVEKANDGRPTPPSAAGRSE